MALVLSRQKGERILIGDDIEIQIVRIDRSQVKLAITAPLEVHILRAELVDRPPRNHGGDNNHG